MNSLEEVLALPITKLKERVFDSGASVSNDLLNALEQDARRGARALARRLRARRQANQAEGQRLRHLLKYESELWAQGFTQIAGVDEAGVGPLAGPVLAGAVILPHAYKLRALDDSKKLAEAKREELAAQLKADAVAWAIGIAEVAEIDRLNIYHASLLAMRRAIEALGQAPDSVWPDYVLVDARTIPEIPVPQRGIIRGDSLSASIAAASILAKTTRDAWMREYEQQYPGYGFAVHKGYPTLEHRRALRERGASPIHRRSFRPVREVLGLEPEQVSLFG